MLRAAPGESVRGAVRWKLSQEMKIPVVMIDRYESSRYLELMMEGNVHQSNSRSKKCSSFTQQLSGYGVERGRLGEVVSQVGDCRPPPPGNPPRPTIAAGMVSRKGNKVLQRRRIYRWPGCVLPRTQENWGIIFLLSMSTTFNTIKIRSNLKILDSSEYFKVNHSYSSCTGPEPVLEFGSFPLPPVWVNGSGTPIYSDYKCSKNAGIIYALPLL